MDNPFQNENAKCQGDCFIQREILDIDSGRLDAEVPSSSQQACVLSRATNMLLSDRLQSQHVLFIGNTKQKVISLFNCSHMKWDRCPRMTSPVSSKFWEVHEIKAKLQPCTIQTIYWCGRGCPLPHLFQFCCLLLPVNPSWVTARQLCQIFSAASEWQPRL